MHAYVFVAEISVRLHLRCGRSKSDSIWAVLQTGFSLFLICLDTILLKNH